MNTRISHRPYESWKTAFVILLFAANSVYAQSNNPNRALQEKLRRMQQQTQTLEQEKSALQSEKDKSAAALISAQRELRRLQASIQQANQLKDEMAQQATELIQQSAELDRVRTLLNEANDQIGSLRNELKREQSRIKTADTALSETLQRLETESKNASICKANNQALYELNTDLLNKYEAAYKASSFLRGGFLTQLDWVRVENESAEIRDRLVNARMR